MTKLQLALDHIIAKERDIARLKLPPTAIGIFARAIYELPEDQRLNKLQTLAGMRVTTDAQRMQKELAGDILAMV